MSFLILYLLFNLFLGAYILGTVTMLVVKGDEQSKAFRERVNQLSDFSRDNDLPQVRRCNTLMHPTRVGECARTQEGILQIRYARTAAKPPRLTTWRSPHHTAAITRMYLIVTTDAIPSLLPYCPCNVPAFLPYRGCRPP